jgi:hypothetical protein
MAAAAILVIQVIAVKWAITTRLLLKLIHRLKKLCSVEKSQKRKWSTASKMAAAAMLEIQVHASKWAITTGLL